MGPSPYNLSITQILYTGIFLGINLLSLLQASFLSIYEVENLSILYLVLVFTQ